MPVRYPRTSPPSLRTQEEERNRLTLEALDDVTSGQVIDHQAVQVWADCLCIASVAYAGKQIDFLLRICSQSQQELNETLVKEQAETVTPTL